MDKYYFDYASCTPIDESIYLSYIKVLNEYYMNSESVYDGGLQVHKLVETSREKIAKLLGVASDEVLFTSGASEANSFAIKGYSLKNKHKGMHIVTSKMEHSSLNNALVQLQEEFGFEVTYLDVHQDGKVYLEDIKRVLRSDTILVCLMAINNEIGSIQDIEKIAIYLKEHTRASFLVDGVQQIGKYEVELKNVDMYTWTTHKLYGVKGCGVLIKKKNIQLLPLIHGGAQEQGLRGGTLNAPACIVAAKTLRLSMGHRDMHLNHIQKLSHMLYEQLNDIEGIVINSNELTCSPYIFNFSWPSMNSEIMMNALNQKGIYVSSQSACSSRTKQPSHTLLAMGCDEAIALGSIRISLSHLTTVEDVLYLIKSIKEIIYEFTT